MVYPIDVELTVQDVRLLYTFNHRKKLYQERVASHARWSLRRGPNHHDTIQAANDMESARQSLLDAAYDVADMVTDWCDPEDIEHAAKQPLEPITHP